MALLMARTDLPAKNTLWDMLITHAALSVALHRPDRLDHARLGEDRLHQRGDQRGALPRRSLDPRPLINIWSYAGVVWVMFLFFCPFAYLFTVGSLRAMDASLEEAARTVGRDRRCRR